MNIETGIARILRYLAVHDSGKIVNRLAAESQVRGSVVMGIGMALTEELKINPDYGSFVNSNFMGYRIPSHTSTPPIDVVFVGSEDPFGPKSLAEIPVVPVLAAVGNAIFNATGVRVRETPFTPERLLSAAEITN